MFSNGFFEFETPFFTKSTPEGARDFIVPSRLNPGMFYALPQSPQLFKQVLMIAGFERYFQIVKCFRDEDLRADRQPEFTQIDMEMSFVDRDDVIAISEGLIKALYEGIRHEPLETPFMRLPYQDAMERYGTDKPDLRFDLPMVELTDIFSNTDFGVFKNIVGTGGAIKAVVLKGKGISRKDLDTAVEMAKQMGSGGLIWIRKEAGAFQSPVVKYLKERERYVMAERLGLNDGDVVFIVADKRSKVNEILGRFRVYLAERYDLIEDDGFRFLWVVDFPLLEYSEEEKRYVARHHPFTSPLAGLRDFDGDYDAIKAKAYDLVLNGCGDRGVAVSGYTIRKSRWRCLSSSISLKKRR